MFQNLKASLIRISPKIMTHMNPLKWNLRLRKCILISKGSEHQKRKSLRKNKKNFRNRSWRPRTVHLSLGMKLISQYQSSTAKVMKLTDVEAIHFWIQMILEPPFYINITTLDYLKIALYQRDLEVLSAARISIRVYQSLA